MPAQKRMLTTGGDSRGIALLHHDVGRGDQAIESFTPAVLTEVAQPGRLLSLGNQVVGVGDLIDGHAVVCPAWRSGTSAAAHVGSAPR